MKIGRKLSEILGVGKTPGRSKYRAVRTTVYGVTFASKKEAARFIELKALEAAGKICGLTLQPRYPLHSKTGVRICNYVADFLYFDGDKPIRKKMRVEDVKGVKTPMYRLKKKWAECEHGITIIEV